MRGQRNVLNTHSDVREMNTFPVIFPPRLETQNQLAQASVNVFISQATLSMHNGRGCDTTMLEHIPAIRHDFLTFRNQFELAFVTRELDRERAGFNVFCPHQRLLRRSNRERHVRVVQRIGNAADRNYRSLPTAPTFFCDRLGAFWRSIEYRDLLQLG